MFQSLLRRGPGSISTWMTEPDPIALPSLEALDWSSTAVIRPWRIGYERARTLRSRLDLSTSVPAPVESLLKIRQTQSPAPMRVDRLIAAAGSTSSAVVVGARVNAASKRFVCGPGHRPSLTPAHGRSLLTRSQQYTERAERAFAAGFLAPAAGAADILERDLSQESLQRR